MYATMAPKKSVSYRINCDYTKQFDWTYPSWHTTFETTLGFGCILVATSDNVVTTLPQRCVSDVVTTTKN